MKTRYIAFGILLAVFAGFAHADVPVRCSLASDGSVDATAIAGNPAFSPHCFTNGTSNIQIKLYKFGVCKVAPTATESGTDLSHCDVLMDSANGVDVDISLSGINVSVADPKPGAYQFIFMILGNTVFFKSSVNFTGAVNGKNDDPSTTTRGKSFCSTNVLRIYLTCLK